MREILALRQSLEATKRLLEQDSYRLYGPEYSVIGWISEALTRLETRRGETGYSDRDRVDLRKAEQILNRMQFIARLYSPNQPRDERGRWTSGGALEKAVKFLEDNAGDESQGQCATLVRQALEDAGFDMKGHPVPAKEYEKFFEDPNRGFTKVVSVKAGEGDLPRWYTPQAGDVAVFQDIPGHRDGHIQMYSGTEWVSDFHQGNKFWPGKDYATAKPHYAIFRHLRTATLGQRLHDR